MLRRKKYSDVITRTFYEHLCKIGLLLKPEPGPWTWTLDPDLGPWTWTLDPDPGPWTRTLDLDPGPRILDPGPRTRTLNADPEKRGKQLDMEK